MVSGRLVVGEKGRGREIASFDVREPKPGYDAIAISGRRGYVTFEAKNFLNAFGIPVYWLDTDGALLGCDVPNSANASGRKQVYQIRAAMDGRIRLDTAREIIATKLLLNGQDAAQTQARHAASLQELNRIENRAAEERRRELFPGNVRKPPRTLEYRARDRLGAALNYCFGIAKGQARALIIGNQLNLGVGFVHNYADSFNYDIEEWYRWSAELAVREVERDLTREDFRVGSDYSVRLSPFSRLKRELIERIGRIQESRTLISGSACRKVSFDWFVQNKLEGLVRAWGYLPTPSQSLKTGTG